MQKPLAVVPLSPYYQFPLVTSQNVILTLSLQGRSKAHWTGLPMRSSDAGSTKASTGNSVSPDSCGCLVMLRLRKDSDMDVHCCLRAGRDGGMSSLTGRL